MGEIADQMINGDSCEVCGIPFEEPGAGYPRKCSGCKRESQQARNSTKALLALIVLAVGTLRASEVQWSRFRGKVKAVNYKSSTVTIDQGGDLFILKVDDDVTIFAGKEAVSLNNVLIDDKVTLIYAPKAKPKDSEEPAPGGVYAPSSR